MSLACAALGEGPGGVSVVIMHRMGFLVTPTAVFSMIADGERPA
jgi:hypothetical protein